ncbi:hypothetical protein JW823_05095 [bacterium]|nr:hypothetical protein [candidate division CSSED10-310 bacterium]
MHDGFRFRKIVRQRLAEERELHPYARIQDYYKLLYQSAFGMEHLVQDWNQFSLFLNHEMSSADPDVSIPLIKDITIFHPVARINLAAAAASGITVDTITRMCVESMRSFKPLTPSVFTTLLADFLTIMINDPFSFTVEQVNTFRSTISDNIFRAVHHSDIYRSLYSPHYRLVDPGTVDK